MTKDLRDIDAIAFDLDGTLVDSAPDIRVALNAALEEAGLERFDLDTVRAWIGDGPDALILQALRRQDLGGSEALRIRLRKAFDAATLAAPLKHGGVFEGIAELVEGLRRALPMVVVTNKPTPLARAVLDAAGLLQPMAGVFGADAAAQRKPAPFLLAAQAAGSPAALVAWGYGGHAALDAAAEAPAWRVATPQQLLLTVRESRAVRRDEETTTTRY